MRKRKAENVEGETDAIGVTIPEDAMDARPYIKMIRDSLRVDEEWQAICDDIEKLYGSLAELANAQRDRRFQIFYANTEVAKNVIYARQPKPTAVGRFNDRRPIIREASEIMERTLTTSFEIGKVHEEVLLRVRDNVSLFGRGVPWMRYYAKGQDKTFTEKVCWEWVHRKDFTHDPARVWSGSDGVQWVARRRWFTEKKGKARFDKRNGKGQYEERRWIDITYKSKPNDRDADYKNQQKAEVWEMWNKELGEVLWIHLDKDELLDRRKPREVLGDLDNFFPCPKPAFGAVEVDTLKPLPDVLQYKDQLEEINTLTRRMAALTMSLKLKGFYPSGVEELGKAIERLLADEDDDSAILEGLSNFAAIGGGTLKDSVVWLPIRDVVEAIKACVELRRQLMDDVFQISGINDIMRGTVDPNEKLGQTEMKGQYGSVRIREKQGEMVRIADDMLAMQAEIIAEQFQPQTIAQMSQKELPAHAQIQQQMDQVQAQLAQAQQALVAAQAQQAAPGMAAPGGPPQGAPEGPPQPGAKPTASAAPPGPDPQQLQQAIAQLTKKLQDLQATVTFEAVIALFREQRTRPFHLKVATDSTISPDENAEKRSRVEFVQALGQLLPQLAAMIMQNPGSVTFAIEILKFATAPYRAGRELEGSIDDFSETVREEATQPKGPSPEQIKAEGEKAKTAADLEGRKMDTAAKAEQAKRDAERAAADQAAAADERAFKMRQLELQAQSEADTRKHDLLMANIALDTKRADLAMKDKDVELKMIELEIARERLKQARMVKEEAGEDDSEDAGETGKGDADAD